MALASRVIARRRLSRVMKCRRTWRSAASVSPCSPVEVVAFVPVEPPATLDRHGPPEVLELLAAEMAVTVHTGPFADLDRAYAALGTYVAERAIGVDGPIRENYLRTAADTPDDTAHRTEVCWPIFQTTPRARS